MKKLTITELLIMAKGLIFKNQKGKKIKIYHDLTCNCYGCRLGTTLKAKN